MASEKEKIRHPFVILCEGLDAKLFMIWYLNSAALSEDPAFSRDVQVFDFGGIQDLHQKLALFKLTPGYEMVQSLLIIRDAERDSTGAVQQIISALQKSDLPAPLGPGIVEDGVPKVGFLLFPTCDTAPTEGTLENLCCKILKEPPDPPIFDEIDAFLYRLQDQGIRDFPRRFKTELHTYLSVTDEYVSLKLGEAARAGAFDWEHIKLAPLKGFMKELFT